MVKNSPRNTTLIVANKQPMLFLKVRQNIEMLGSLIFDFLILFFKGNNDFSSIKGKEEKHFEDGALCSMTSYTEVLFISTFFKKLN